MKPKELREEAVRIARHYNKAVTANVQGDVQSFDVNGVLVVFTSSNDIEGLTIKVGNFSDNQAIVRKHFNRERSEQLMKLFIDKAIQFVKGWQE